MHFPHFEAAGFGSKEVPNVLGTFWRGQTIFF